MYPQSCLSMDSLLGRVWFNRKSFCLFLWYLNVFFIPNENKFIVVFFHFDYLVELMLECLSSYRHILYTGHMGGESTLHMSRHIVWNIYRYKNGRWYLVLYISLYYNFIYKCFSIFFLFCIKKNHGTFDLQMF